MTEPMDCAMDDPNDNTVAVVLSTVDGHVSAMIVCQVCERVFADTDKSRVVSAVEIAECDHSNRLSLWNYLGSPL